MTITDWLIVFLVIQVIHFLGTWKLYQKAGFKAWEAAVPVYNAYILTKIINRHWSWVILLLIPVINVIMLPIIWVETLRSFGKNSALDTFLGVITLGFYIYYINYTQDVKHIKDRSLQPRTAAGEWTSSILFAIVAASIVHTYIMQPYNIPTSSLEKTLLVGDFLFVSKFHYGARTPMTAVSLPMVHDTIPKTKLKSYLPKIQLPYFRIPGFQKIKRSDIVVFNWPVDTVNAFATTGGGDGKYHFKPIDKKSNYVKRCVGIPGDSLSIIDGKIFINKKPLKLPQKAKPQYSYKVVGKGKGFSLKNLYKQLDITDRVIFLDQGINPNTQENVIYQNQKNYIKGQKPFRIKSLDKNYIFSSITELSAKRLKKHSNVASIKRMISPKENSDLSIFPYIKDKMANKDQLDSFYIPEEGKTVAITTQSIPFYKRIIEVYEGTEMGVNNTISISGNQVLLNNSPITNYTFKQNYYWMMGDNRHNSEDSRYWGYVPETHIVGKPVFLFMSFDSNAGLKNKIRWNRLMTTVGGDGKLTSYRYLVFGLILAYFAFSYFRSKKEKA